MDKLKLSFIEKQSLNDQELDKLTGGDCGSQNKGTGDCGYYNWGGGDCGYDNYGGGDCQLRNFKKEPKKEELSIM